MNNFTSRLLARGAALLMLCGAGSCGGSDSDDDSPAPFLVPTVMSSTPLDVAVDVPVNGNATATFSEA
ncbi:MAG TPA: Ig-like domain-containing protein, partial [Gemmatimonadales bacterium]|nr:Ig-like domain-containing protein [Gemmatimonadales bacterium]